MGKNPAFQFYPSDWSRDLEEHPLEIEGAWIRICCKLWWSETPGRLTKTSDQWKRILGISNVKFEKILNYLHRFNIGIVERNENGLVNQNGDITIISRRMIRDEYIRKIRKEAGEKGGNPALKNNDVLLNQNSTIPPSKTQPLHLQSSSSSSKTKRINTVFIKPTIEEISAYCKERENQIDPVQWFNHYESNGWKVGKNPMKNWKSAIITWEKNEPIFSKEQKFL